MLPARDGQIEKKRLEVETLELLKKHKLLLEDTVAITGSEYLALKSSVEELRSLKSLIDELKSTVEQEKDRTSRYEKNWLNEIEEVKSLKKEILRLNKIISLGDKAYVLDPECSGPNIKIKEALDYWLRKIHDGLESWDCLNPTCRLIKMDGKVLLQDKYFSVILLEALKNRYEPEGWDVAILAKGISFLPKEKTLGLVRTESSNIFFRLFYLIKNKSRSFFM